MGLLLHFTALGEEACCGEVLLYWSPLNAPAVLAFKNWRNKRALSDWRIIRVTDSQAYAQCPRRGYTEYCQKGIAAYHMQLNIIVL